MIRGKLPYCEIPRSLHHASVKMRGATAEMDRSIEEYAYRMGVWYTWVRHHVHHGEFESWVIENTRWTPRTARRMMKFAAECAAAQKVLPYHPSGKSGTTGKSDTVSVLESPPETEESQATKGKRPYHTGGESLVWNATECAERLLASFEKMTQRRAVEEMRDVLDAFNELAQEYIKEREEQRKIFRREEEID